MATEDRGPSRGREVATAARRFWWLGLLVALPLVLGAGVYARSLPDQYEVEALVAFTPRQRPETSADLVELLLPKYAVYAQSDQTLRRVAGRLDEDPEEVAAALSAVVPPDTAQLELRIDLGDGRRSARMANAVADDVVRFARADPVLGASVVTDAVEPEQPTGPSRMALVGAGTVVALVAGLFAAVVAHRRRPVAVRLAEAGPVRQEPRVRRPPTRSRVAETSAR